MDIFKKARNIEDLSNTAYIRRDIDLIGKYLANRLYPNISTDLLDQTTTIVAKWVYIQAIKIYATYHISMVGPYIYSDLLESTEEVQKFTKENGFNKPTATLDELVNFVLSNDTKRIKDLKWNESDDCTLYIMRTILDRLNFEIALIGDK